MGCEMASSTANIVRGFLSPWCTLTSEEPFIKHIPIAIVMSISHDSTCARMGRAIPPRSEQQGVMTVGQLPAGR